MERKRKRNRRGLGILPYGNLLRADVGRKWRISPVSGHRQCFAMKEKLLYIEECIYKKGVPYIYKSGLTRL